METVALGTTSQTKSQSGSADAGGSLRASVRKAWPVLLLGVAGSLLIAGMVTGVLTKPKPDLDGPLDRAQAQIDDGEFEAALETLNTKVLPLVGKPWVSNAEKGRYHLEVARSVYYGQRDLGIHNSQNDETIRKAYLAAEKAGAELTPDDVVALCDTLVALDRDDQAWARVQKLPETASSQRRTILRALVEHELAKPAPDYAHAIEILTTITEDPDISLADRAWSLARETEIRLGQGYLPEAISRLAQGIVRLDKAPKVSLAELYVLLGQAHYELGEYESAIKQLERAVGLLGATEPMRARAEVYLARCEQSMGQVEAARDRYASVVSWAEGMDWYLPALLGLAETEGLLGRTEDSIQAYTKVVGQLLENKTHPQVSKSRVAASLMARAQDALALDDPKSALRFVLRAEELFPKDDVPADVLNMLAVAHRTLANQMIGVGPGQDASDVDITRVIGGLDPATRKTVQRHFIAAGKYASRYADAMVLKDNEAYVDSLWQSALDFDYGGAYRKAASQYQAYISNVPDDASATARRATQAQARYRLGRVYQALGEYGLAESVFGALIADGDKGLVGQYGQKSFVPMAQCLLADDKDDNDDKAMALLIQAVSGKIGGEGSAYFHDALIELAKLYHKQGNFERAIERLTEVLERYPNDDQQAVVTYLLADSKRQEAESIAQTLATEAMPDGQKVTLENKRVAYLKEALAGFASVRDALESKEDARLTDTERVSLRNAYYFLGDCAFDLGDYAAAIKHYDAARERYASDPASLVAMVQIVNAYVAMGDLERARAANERAKRFYASLPDEVWNDPYLPMTRKDWEQWLDSTAQLYGFGAEQTTGNSGN